MQAMHHTVATKEARTVSNSPPGGPSIFTGAPPGPADDHAATQPAPRGFDLLAEGLGLQGGGNRPTIFPPLKWAAVEKASTLAKVKTVPAVRLLTQIFAEAGFPANVNFNVVSVNGWSPCAMFRLIPGHAPCQRISLVELCRALVMCP